MRTRWVAPLVATAIGIAGLLLLPALGPDRVDAETEARFLPAERCALCHSTSPEAAALRDAEDRDVSPTFTWQASMMAHAFLDPYWRAKVEEEVAADPEHAAEIREFCMRCHAPMAIHGARLAARPAPAFSEAEKDPLARDGVSCTMCHGIAAADLGEDATFSGNAPLTESRVAFGPYEAPFARPMLHHTGFVATYGPHVADAAACGTCHTLFTQHAPGAPAFLEQGPFLEWRNSVYARGDRPRSCVHCHMQNAGSLRIARNPGGRDFPRVRERPDVRTHDITGGNAAMIALIAANREAVGATAPQAAFERMLAAEQALRSTAARLDIVHLRRTGTRISFDVRVRNLTGHKLPTAYPSRRIWLRVRVALGERPLFVSGDVTSAGEIVGTEPGALLPHRSRVESADEVVVWEAVPVDAAGHLTTRLVAMAGFVKDTRLLPAGWTPAGPDGDLTAAVGVGDDGDFVPGGDTVTYEVEVDSNAPLTVTAELLHQSLPPAWIEPLRQLESPAARAFLEMVSARPERPRVLAVATRTEGN